MNVLKKMIFPNIYCIDDHLFTRNQNPGFNVYGEELLNIDGVEYRFWDPYRSKLAAMIKNGAEKIPISADNEILYLGAASGTTVSHLSDIVTNGRIFSVEFSARSFRDLLKLAESRKNIIPILENVFHPERYHAIVPKVEIIYQDISQRDQVNALMINLKMFLKPHGFVIFLIKARSIDITKQPSEVFHEVISMLKQKNLKIHEKIPIEPYSKDHLGIILQRR